MRKGGGEENFLRKCEDIKVNDSREKVFTHKYSSSDLPIIVRFTEKEANRFECNFHGHRRITHGSQLNQVLSLDSFDTFASSRVVVVVVEVVASEESEQWISREQRVVKVGETVSVMSAKLVRAVVQLER